MPTADQRRFPRYEVEDLRGQLALSSEARVLDVGLGGIALETANQLALDKIYSLAFQLEDDERVLRGTAKWCELSATRKEPGGDVEPVFRAGLAFDDVLSDRARELLQFLRHALPLEAPDRVFGRFRVGETKPLWIETRVDFRVQVLSRCGMLMGLGLPPRTETVHELEIALNGEHFATRGRMVNLRRHSYDVGMLFHVGVEFVDTSPGEATKLQRFIDTTLAATGSPA